MITMINKRVLIFIISLVFFFLSSICYAQSSVPETSDRGVINLFVNGDAKIIPSFTSGFNLQGLKRFFMRQVPKQIVRNVDNVIANVADNKNDNRKKDKGIKTGKSSKNSFVRIFFALLGIGGGAFIFLRKKAKIGIVIGIVCGTLLLLFLFSSDDDGQESINLVQQSSFNGCPQKNINELFSIFTTTWRSHVSNNQKFVIMNGEYVENGEVVTLDIEFLISPDEVNFETTQVFLDDVQLNAEQGANIFKILCQ